MASTDTRVIVEWSWAVFNASYRRLHHVAQFGEWDDDMPVGKARTSCGRSGNMSIPGIFSRMGMMRCRQCCAALGWPCGKGSPKNDDRLRPLVRQRLDGEDGDRPAGGEPMTADTLRSWTVELPISEHLSSNHRRHWRHEAQVRATIREAAGWAMRTARVPHVDRIDVRLYVVPPDKRRRDRHNLNPTLKPCLDGIVDAAVIDDDSPDYVASEQIVLCAPDGSRRWRWWLTVTEVEA